MSHPPEMRCGHNSHSHAALWFWLLLSVMWSNFADCSGDRAKIRDLERRIDKLESKVH